MRQCSAKPGQGTFWREAGSRRGWFWGHRPGVGGAELKNSTGTGSGFSSLNLLRKTGSLSQERRPCFFVAPFRNNQLSVTISNSHAA